MATAARLEPTQSARRVFSGRLLNVDVIDVVLDNGQCAQREVVHHPGAVAVLASLPDGRFVWVRQFRKAVEQELLEVIAGCLKPGEDPAACAAREVLEETGHRVTSLRSLGLIYPTPGYGDEVIHLFQALVEEERAAQAPDPDERIAVIYLTAAEIETLIDDGRVRDGKSLAVWLKAARPAATLP